MGATAGGGEHRHLAHRVQGHGAHRRRQGADLGDVGAGGPHQLVEPGQLAVRELRREAHAPRRHVGPRAVAVEVGQVAHVETQGASLHDVARGHAGKPRQRKGDGPLSDLDI